DLTVQLGVLHGAAPPPAMLPDPRKTAMDRINRATRQRNFRNLGTSDEYSVDSAETFPIP
ncbi:MAG TPA: hypothetical protein PLN52_26235, partial [Opitutaceae bacterium]|nr:hypothetical protein [Opitutaceae bacterium]